MKKIILALIATSAVAVSGYGQGLVNFAAGGTASTRISTNSVVGGSATGATAPTAGLYYYALFASSSQSSVNGQTTSVSGINANYVFNNLGGGTPSTGWELVGIGSNIASLGRATALSQGTTSANQGAVNGDNSLTVQGIAASANANMVVIGWSAGIGTTLAALEQWYAAGAANGWIGQSAIASVVLGDGVSAPTPNPFGTAAGQIGGFTLGLTPAATPEPGTIALAGLGIASLLALRRKK